MTNKPYNKRLREGTTTLQKLNQVTRRKDVGLAAIIVVVSQLISASQSTKSVGAELAVLGARIEVMNEQIKRLDERISDIKDIANLGGDKHANREVLHVGEGRKAHADRPLLDRRI